MEKGAALVIKALEKQEVGTFRYVQQTEYRKTNCAAGR
jgi:hypothetical protein